MRDSKKSEIKVGITVFAAIIIFLLLYGWASNLTLLEDRIEISIQFDSVAGLEIGDPVTINGLKKGVVKDILLENNSAIAKVLLQKDVSLKMDATFSIMMLDLMGGKKIEIKPGVSNEALDCSMIQEGNFLGDISTAMAMLSSVQNDLIRLIKDFQISLTNINSLMSDKNFQTDIKNTFTNLNKISLQINDLILENKNALNQLLNEGRQLVGMGSEFFEQNNSKVSSFFENSEVLLKNLNAVVINADKIIQETSQQENNLGKILYDEEIYKSLKDSALELAELLKLLNSQLKEKGIKVDADIF